MTEQNQAYYMGSNGFSRRVRFVTSTPTALYGICKSKSVHISLMDSESGPTIDTYRGRPHRDPNYVESLVATYFLTDEDFERHSWLRLSDRIVAWMTVLFGKQFSIPEIIQVNGNWKQSKQSNNGTKIWNRELPFISDEERKDLPTKLDLGCLKRIEELVYSRSEAAKKLNAAAEFYTSALQKWLTEPERAFLDLVTAGECLIDLETFEWKDLAHSDSLKIDESLRASGDDKLAKLFRSGKTFISGRYVETITRNIPETVFTTMEYASENSDRFTRDNLKKSLKAAYSLRSLFVHDGAEFGTYTSVMSARAKAELWGNFAQSVTDHGHSEADGASKILSKNMVKKISKSATFIGLERVTRSAILMLTEKYKDELQVGCEGRFSGPLATDRSVIGQWVKLHPDDAKKLK